MASVFTTVKTKDHVDQPCFLLSRLYRVSLSVVIRTVTTSCLFSPFPLCPFLYVFWFCFGFCCFKRNLNISFVMLFAAVVDAAAVAAAATWQLPRPCSEQCLIPRICCAPHFDWLHGTSCAASVSARRRSRRRCWGRKGPRKRNEAKERKEICTYRMGRRSVAT